MKLEDEIQQKKFKTPQQKLAVNLLYTTNWLNNHYSHFFKGMDITTQQYNVLRILRGQYPNICNLKLIKERMLDRMSDASRIIDKLVLKGYVERKTCPDDRRNVNILITEQGLTLLKELDFIDESTKQMFDALSTKQVDDLNELLDKLRDSSLHASFK
ncbi:MAG: MarR family transcriptional regulator [Bacteroidota bacterium]|nr:MarR family transcriptional regulator [Bacteroidota bacterium]